VLRPGVDPKEPSPQGKADAQEQEEDRRPTHAGVFDNALSNASYRALDECADGSDD
jgi:hypothetical protein